MITALMAFYLGGITTLLVGELDSPAGSLQVSDVFYAMAWPITAIAMIVTAVNDYRKGV